MADPRLPWMRNLIPWIMVGAYTLILLVAGRSVVALRDNQRTAIADQLEIALQDTVAAWEDELQQRLTGWMEGIRADVERAERIQHQMRRGTPWFNSLYVWTIQHRARLGDKEVVVPPEILFPYPQVPDDREAAVSSYCVQRARMLVATARVDPVTVARAYTVGCRSEPLSIRMYAASEAAELLDNAGLYREALAALDAAGVPDSLTLTAAVREQISPFRLTIHRVQRATLLRRVGRAEEALDLLERVGTEICLLDAPNVAPLITWVRWPVLPHLEKAKRKLAYARISDLLDRAERRVRAFRELEERIVPLVPRPNTTEFPQPIYDQYSARPYILWYGWEGRTGVALQLEQHLLVEDFLANKSVARLRPWLVVTDNGGTVVAGDPRARLAITVPFRGVLGHLRVGLDEDAVEATATHLKAQWLVPAAILVLCAVLGFTALAFQIRASRQQIELLKRQREFTTRVTHELKTPLAGIRVMAENLELGAYRDEDQRRDMAARIVAEADRLTARVEEILDAARARTIPRPETFDPEEAAYEAIDQWGPRLEAAGMELRADLHPTAEVLGDPRALRDAIGCLLDNALKYRRADRDDARVELRLDQRGDTVRIEVADNGIGVPPAMRDAIFDRFVRVEGPNRGLAGGYGLGLAQVAEIVAAHRGRVWCEEGPEGGARFVIELPAATR